MIYFKCLNSNVFYNIGDSITIARFIQKKYRPVKFEDLQYFDNLFKDIL